MTPYFADTMLANAFVVRWCVVARAEATGGVFQVREDEPMPRVGRACTIPVSVGEPR
jgi:hypothetical protein